jgi:hypothetical protein
MLSYVHTESFREVKWPQRGVDHQLPSSAELRMGRSCILAFLLCMHWHVLG